MPLLVEEVTYCEIVFVEHNNYFEENKDLILEELKQKTGQNVRSYDIIKDEYYNISSFAGTNRITYTIIASGSAL